MMPATPIFEVKNLSYDYSGNIPALKDISFVVLPDQAVARDFAGADSP